MISIVVGDLEGIKLYLEKGFQIHQEVPHDVWSAYEELVKARYNFPEDLGLWTTRS